MTLIFLFAGIIGMMIMSCSMMDFVEAKQIDEKSLVKEKIKDKMVEQTDKDQKMENTSKKYTSDEYGIPYNLFYEDNDGNFIVGIDIEKALGFEKEYSIDEIKSDLGTESDSIKIQYYGFDRETALNTNVYGGNLIKKSLGGNNYEDSTITLVRDGKIILTGHIEDVIVGSTLYIVCGTANEICNTTVKKNPSSSRQIADSAYATTTHQLLNLQENKIKYGSHTYSVIDGTISDITKYGAVKMSGITTRSSGYILDTSATVKDVGGVLDDQVIASYRSGDGDSGAPVFKMVGGDAKILGQHVGKFCKVDLNSNYRYGQWCTNLDSRGNPIDNTGALTVFTPWHAVKSNLGIR